MVAPVLKVFQRWGGQPEPLRDLNADSVNQPFRTRADHYDVCEAYYANTAYEVWNTAVRSLAIPANLYRHTRGVYNPLRRAVDWYPGALYPGEFTVDGLALPDGTPCCVPFAADTRKQIRLPAMTALGWGNWASDRYVYASMLPMLGDAFGEIEIDYARGKSYPRLHHPRYVTDIAWNATGDVVEYRLDIPSVDKETGERYKWGKIVTKDTITLLKNGEPFAYDQPEAEGENVFGFVPGVWVQFRNRGGQHGQSLLDAVRPKVDRLNSSTSSIHDYIAKFAAQGVVIRSDSPLKNIMVLGQNGVATTMEEYDAGQSEIRYMKVPAGTEFDRLIEDLGLAAATEYIHSLIAEIEADLPEATMDEKIRQHPQIAGVSLRMMFGDVAKRHAEALGNADAGLRKFIQMNISVQAHLIRTGAFGFIARLTDEQRQFLEFDLTSFQRGELDFSFLPRPLFPETPEERAANAKAREAVRTPTGLKEVGYDATAVEALMLERQRATAADRLPAFSNAGWPLVALAREAGYDEEQITQLLADDDAATEQARQRFDAGELPPVTPVAPGTGVPAEEPTA